MKPITVLFDLDGVIIDTESQYDVFWKKTGEDYLPEIEHFEHKVKGTTMPDILKTYFSHLSQEEQEKILRGNIQFEEQMSFDPLPGSLEFIHDLKKNGIRIGLVTSSDDRKLRLVSKSFAFKNLFDTIVSADRITRGKPDPMCYLLAARDLGALPGECIVFEDSFPGIEAGTRAGMKVIGLSTSNPAESIRDKVIKVIPDFEGFSTESLSEILFSENELSLKS